MSFTYYTNKYTDDKAHMSPEVQQIFLKKLLSRCNLQKRSHILDFGCGYGYNLSTLRRDSFRLYACDVSEKVIKANKRNFTDVHFFLTDGKSLKQPSKMFDLVVCTEVLEHVEHQSFLIQEFSRVLKDSGFLIISTPNYFNFTGVIKKINDKKKNKEWWDPWKAHRGGIERFMTYKKIQDLLSNRFIVIRAYGYDYYTSWLYFLNIWGMRKLLTPLNLFGGIYPFKNLGMHYMVLAKKCSSQ